MLQYVLYSARTRAKLTLQTVAERTGLTEGYLSMLEHGKRTPSAEVLPVLGKAYDISGETLLAAIAAGSPCRAPRRTRPEAPNN